MNKWLAKMFPPRQNEYAKLKTTLKELERKLEADIKFKSLNFHLLEEYKKVFKRIVEGRNHLSPGDAGQLQSKIKAFITHFKDYGFEEILVNTEQPQSCVSRKPHLVVDSYGSWSKPPDSQKCEDMEMKTPTNRFKYVNEVRRQSKGNNEIPSVHQGLQKQQMPPGMSYHQKRPSMRGGYKPEDADEQKQKIEEMPPGMTSHQIRPLLRGGYKPEDAEEQKQKIEQMPPGTVSHQIRPSMRGGYNPEDVKEQKQKTEQLPSGIAYHQGGSFMRGGYNPEDVEEQKQKIAKDVNLHDVRDIEAKMMQQTQNERERSSNLQSTSHETRNADDGERLIRQRMEQEKTKVLGPCQGSKCIETRDINQITTSTSLQEKEGQDRSYQSHDEENRRQRITTSQKYLEDEDNKGDLGHFKRQNKEKKANRRSYSVTQEHAEPQDYQAVATSVKLSTQYQQDKSEYKSHYTKEEEKRKRSSDPLHVEPQNICHGAHTRLKHSQDQKHQDNEEKALDKEKGRSYNDSKDYTEHQNIHHGVATRQKDINQQAQYSRDYPQKQNLAHGVTIRQKKIQHQQDENEYKRPKNEEKTSEEKNRSCYNVSKEYLEQQNSHHGVAAWQMQQQQFYNEKLIEEENSRRCNYHQEKYLEAQSISQGFTTRQSHQQDHNQYNEEKIYYDNYDRKHKPRSGGDSHVTGPCSEEYYIQAAREDGTYDRYREAAVQTSPAHQVRGRGRTHNLPINYQHLEIKTAQEVEDEPLQILDVHQYFQDDFDLKTLDSSIDVLTQIETIERWSRSFEDKVNNFSEAKFSLEYFVIDEKLMRMIEHLDKLKCKDNPEGTKRKIQVIQYIKDLQTTLDKRAIDE